MSRDGGERTMLMDCGCQIVWPLYIVALNHVCPLLGVFLSFVPSVCQQCAQLALFGAPFSFHHNECGMEEAGAGESQFDAYGSLFASTPPPCGRGECPYTALGLQDTLYHHEADSKRFYYGDPDVELLLKDEKEETIEVVAKDEPADMEWPEDTRHFSEVLQDSVWNQHFQVCVCVCVVCVCVCVCVVCVCVVGVCGVCVLLVRHKFFHSYSWPNQTAKPSSRSWPILPMISTFC